MSMDYIRRIYGVPAKRGGRVSYTAGKTAVLGTIVSARENYLRVRFDESGKTRSMHPTWMMEFMDSQTSMNQPPVKAAIAG